MIENYDFIQLPPIKKDTPSEVVSMIWQYLKLPEESRKRVKADLIDVHENCGKEDFQIPDLYDIVPNPDKPEKLFLFSTPCVILKKKGVFICYSLINTLIKFMASLPVMTA